LDKQLRIGSLELMSIIMFEEVRTWTADFGALCGRRDNIIARGIGKERFCTFDGGIRKEDVEVKEDGANVVVG
jgi:hypothetical protein